MSTTCFSHDSKKTFFFCHSCAHWCVEKKNVSVLRCSSPSTLNLFSEIRMCCTKCFKYQINKQVFASKQTETVQVEKTHLPRQSFLKLKSRQSPRLKIIWRSIFQRCTFPKALLIALCPLLGGIMIIFHIVLSVMHRKFNTQKVNAIN